MRRFARLPDPKTMPATPLNPTDLYDVRSLLTDEERMVQDTVARFTASSLIHVISRTACSTQKLREGSLGKLLTFTPSAAPL